MRNLFIRVQIMLLSLPGSQQVPVVGVRWRIAWYQRHDCDPCHMHAVPLSFIPCSHPPLSPKGEARGCCLVPWTTLTLLFLRMVSSLLEPHVGAFLLPYPLSPTGDQGFFPSSLPGLGATSHHAGTLCSGWWEAEPCMPPPPEGNQYAWVGGASGAGRHSLHLGFQQKCPGTPTWLWLLAQLSPIWVWFG